MPRGLPRGVPTEPAGSAMSGRRGPASNRETSWLSLPARSTTRKSPNSAFDQIVGRGRWHPRRDVGTIPVRFPHPDDPGDAGWHVDLSFPGEDCDPNETRDFSAWRVNVTSRGRALLLLFLFSDVGEDDAPTRIRVGSHGPMARYLAPAGEAGRARMVLDEMGADCPVALATGAAGTVYLCHPFLVHAAQMHQGTRPRFMAQPSLPLAEPYRSERLDGAYSPVEIAIRLALDHTWRR